MFKLNTLTFLFKHIKYCYEKTVKCYAKYIYKRRETFYMLNKVKEEKLKEAKSKE